MYLCTQKTYIGTKKVKRLLRKRKRADGNYGSLFSVIHYETFNL